MKPHVICHMMVSLDGRIHPSRWTASPDGEDATCRDVHPQYMADQVRLVMRQSTEFSQMTSRS
jgi:hypothetical protein